MGIELWSSVPRSAVARMSRIECRVSQNMFRRGQRLMIIELEKDNETNQLLIGHTTTGLLGHVCYWDIGQRV